MDNAELRRRHEQWLSKPEGDVSRGQLEDSRTIVALLDRIERLEAALRGVVAVADRKTDEFDAARAALGEKPCS